MLYINKLYWENEKSFLTANEEVIIERLENDLPTFEVTGSETNVCNMYFDIDYHIEGEETYNNEIDKIICNIGKTYISKCVKEIFKVEPIIAVATSSYEKKYSWRYFVPNVKMKKNEICSFIIDMNKYIEKDSDIYDYIENKGEGLFDTGIYDNNRKMRCINTSKPNENRPLKLVEGTIAETLITGFMDNANLVSYEKEQEQQLIIQLPSPTSVADTSILNDGVDMNDIDYLLCVCIKENLCKTGDHTEWVKIGQALKNELGDNATEPFLKWTYKFGSENKKAEALQQITKYIKKVPLKDKERLTIKTIHYYAKKYSPDLYANRFMKIKQVELDVEVIKLLENPTDYEYANYFCKNWGSNFKTTDIKNRIGFAFTKSKLWEQFENATPMREILSNEMRNNLLKLQNILYEQSKSINSATDESEKIKRQLKKIEESCIKLQKTNDKNNICREILDKTLDTSFENLVNKEKFVLPIKSGKLLNMKTLEVTERTIDNYFNYECDANYIQMTMEEEEDIRKYFLDLFCGDEKVMQCVLDILKSCFTGVTLRYIYFLTGTGRNGKSLLFNILTKIFKKAIDVLDTKIIITDKATSSLSTQFEKLDKCRIGYVTELTENDKINSAMLKKISGGDPIDYRGLYKGNKTINPTCNLFGLTNKLPSCDLEQAILDRLIIIPFNNTFEVDCDFEAKMLQKKDLIFSFIMKYGVIRDKFDLPESMLVAKEDYKYDNTAIDYLEDFINATYERVPYVKTEKIKRDEFRLAYNIYLKTRGQSNDNSSHHSFAKLIKNKNIGLKESHGKTYYTGLVMKEMNDLDTDDEE